MYILSKPKEYEYCGDEKKELDPMNKIRIKQICILGFCVKISWRAKLFLSETPRQEGLIKIERLLTKIGCLVNICVHLKIEYKKELMCPVCF